MPVRDRFDMALLALAAIVKQSERPCEIVVVDDGSSEPFERHLDDLRAVAEERGIMLRVVRNETPAGVSAARNRGFIASREELVCFCDSDDYWDPKKLDTILTVFRTSPKIEVLCHSFRWVGGTLRAFRFIPANKLLMLPKWLLVSFAFLNPSCLCIRRNAFDAGFREDMRYHEDLDFFLRIANRHDIWLLNNPLMEMGARSWIRGRRFASRPRDAPGRGRSIGAISRPDAPRTIGLREDLLSQIINVYSAVAYSRQW